MVLLKCLYTENHKGDVALPEKNETLSERAYFLIRSAIMRGDLLPGARLKEENLSSSMGMSRTPIRAALHRLLNEGLLASDESRTLKVPEITIEDLKKTFQAREVVEGALAEIACIQGTDEDFTKIENIIWQQEIAYAEHDTHLSLALDRMFHNLIADLSGNDFLKDFENRILIKCSNLLLLSRTFGDPMIQALKEHQEIVRSLRTGDPAKARDTAIAHLRKVAERINKAAICSANNKSSDRRDG